MAPQHKNPAKIDRIAKAPYNFVPVSDRVIAFKDDANSPVHVDHSRYHANRLTGWIDVALETKSPIYVRGSLTPDEHSQREREEMPGNTTPHLDKLRNKPDFFHTGNPHQPVIPGSSLRGMLRTMVEILGHGKLSRVNDNPLIHRAVADTTSHGNAYRDLLFETDPHERHHYTPRFQGGYIVKGEEDDRWYIRPAQTHNSTTFARISHTKLSENGLEKGLKPWSATSRNAKEIFVELGEYKYRPVRGGFIHIKRSVVTHASRHDESGLVRAALAKSGYMNSKKSEIVIFAPNETATLIAIPDGTDENDNRDLVAAYIDQISPDQEKLLGKEGVLHDNHPILYLMAGDKLIFFGHTQMFRLPYPRSPRQLLPAPNRDENLIDFAEAMFGRAKGQEQGTAGRLFVSDAALSAGQTNPWLASDSVIIPKILSGPKPTTFQHYVTQSMPDRKEELHTYNSSRQQTTLRGFKLYWHKKGLQPTDYKEPLQAVDPSKDTQHTKMKPVRPGITFSFRIRFENLRLEELGLLWWAVALPTAGNYCHKIGMGKPLGLGSVKLTPRLVLINPEKRYTTFLQNEALATGVVGEEVVAHYVTLSVQKFEQFVCRQLKYHAFAEADRVQMLLKMLSWPGQTVAKTRYMEIERRDPDTKKGKRNEYRDRPVLPNPLHKMFEE